MDVNTYLIDFIELLDIMGNFPSHRKAVFHTKNAHITLESVIGYTNCFLFNA